MKQNLKSKNWQKIIIGIRIKLNLSMAELAQQLKLGRQTLCRFEIKSRVPNGLSIIKILDFIKKNHLDINNLVEIANPHIYGHISRQKIKKLNLPKSKELAELIGIILGDGEIRKDGSIRISFDPKKDLNFVYKRVFLLIKELLGNQIYFESDKRIAFGNVAFVRFLADIGLKAGSKFHNNIKFPMWCFEKPEYLKSILRGLFDTDGYIGYCNGSIEIMFGRFSEKSINLVYDIVKALKYLNFVPSTHQSNDGRYKIRLSSKSQVILFFKIIGSSNIKNISRFLLWRVCYYPAKIEKEGLNELILKCNNILKDNISDIKLPYFWEINDIIKPLISDEEFIRKRIKMRKLFKERETFEL